MEIHHQLTPVNKTCLDYVQYPYRNIKINEFKIRTWKALLWRKLNRI